MARGLPPSTEARLADIDSKGSKVFLKLDRKNVVSVTVGWVGTRELDQTIAEPSSFRDQLAEELARDHRHGKGKTRQHPLTVGQASAGDEIPSRQRLLCVLDVAGDWDETNLRAGA